MWRAWYCTERDKLERHLGGRTGRTWPLRCQRMTAALLLSRYIVHERDNPVSNSRRSNLLPGSPSPLFPLGMLALLLFLICKITRGPFTEQSIVGSPQEVLLQKGLGISGGGQGPAAGRDCPLGRWEGTEVTLIAARLAGDVSKAGKEKKSLSKQSKEREKHAHMFIATLCKHHHLFLLLQPSARLQKGLAASFTGRKTEAHRALPILYTCNLYIDNIVDQLYFN